MGPDFYEQLGEVIIWSTCAIIILRFWKQFYALYLERKENPIFGFFFAPFRAYRAYKKEYMNARKEWANEVIQDNRRESK